MLASCSICMFSYWLQQKINCMCKLRLQIMRFASDIYNKKEEKKCFSSKRRFVVISHEDMTS